MFSQMFADTLRDHNLEAADLEARGQAAPEIHEKGHDLGKAAFTWKLNLAELIAEHFFCHSIVDHKTKSILFLGRPDNVESLQMLYTWLIEQIKQIASAKRKEHQTETGEHIDPLRWQVQFGVGIVSRLGTRFEELKAKQQAEAGNALVVHHQSEISDFTEKKYGYRTDGRKTVRQQKNEAYWARQAADREANQARLDLLKQTDRAAYDRECPWDRLKSEKELEKEAKQQAKRKAQREAQWKREEDRAARREANKTPEQLRAEEQQFQARSAGRASATEVNLEPFLNDKQTNETTKLK